MAETFGDVKLVVTGDLEATRTAAMATGEDEPCLAALRAGKVILGLEPDTRGFDRAG